MQRLSAHCSVAPHKRTVRNDFFLGIFDQILENKHPVKQILTASILLEDNRMYVLQNKKVSPLPFH